MKIYFRKIYNSTRYAIFGIKYAYTHDKSFRMEIWGSIGFISVGVIFWPITYIELLFLVLSYVIILVTELINTAFETAFHKLHPERHELIGASKDIASGAVLISFLFATLVVVIIFANRFLL